MTKDMSTYEYIVEAEENASKWSDLEEGRMPAAKSGCKKVRFQFIVGRYQLEMC